MPKPTKKSRTEKMRNIIARCTTPSPHKTIRSQTILRNPTIGEPSRVGTGKLTGKWKTGSARRSGSSSKQQVHKKWRCQDEDWCMHASESRPRQQTKIQDRSPKLPKNFACRNRWGRKRQNTGYESRNELESDGLTLEKAGQESDRHRSDLCAAEVLDGSFSTVPYPV